MNPGPVHATRSCTTELQSRPQKETQGSSRCVHVGPQRARSSPRPWPASCQAGPPQAAARPSLERPGRLPVCLPSPSPWQIKPQMAKQSPDPGASAGWFTSGPCRCQPPAVLPAPPRPNPHQAGTQQQQTQHERSLLCGIHHFSIGVQRRGVEHGVTRLGPCWHGELAVVLARRLGEQVGTHTRAPRMTHLRVRLEREAVPSQTAAL